jgi:hypothetical protein
MRPMSHSVKDEVYLRWRAVSDHRVGLRGAEHQHSVARTNGRPDRVTIGWHDLRRIVGKRERNGHLAAFGIDKNFCNSL